jgi:formylglycine-generating enzyme required for sulfatase activity
VPPEYKQKSELMKNYYQIMEISRTATQDEIKKQYRFLSQAWHPDKFPTPEQKEKAEEKLKGINEAYSILGNPAKRREYDRLTDYQQEPHSEANTQYKKSTSKDEQGKETPKRENTPVKSKNRLTGLLVVLSAIGVLLCVTLLIFSLINQSSETATLPTNSVLPTNTKLVPRTTDEVITLPTITPTATNTSNYIDDMIFIPAGEFTMGQNNNASNETSHLVNLNDFYIDKYEVTNSMYSKCVNAGFCTPPTKSDSPSNPFYFGNPEFSTYPVIYVTWDMANAFCEWREARLPTEAEWEKAARGNDGRIYPWGNEFTENRSNFCDTNCPREWKNKDYNDGYADTAPIGSFPQGQSPYGVFDMSGNVYEWVADWSNLESGQEPVIRGGAWSDSLATNATSRATFSSSSAYEFIGFRCASSTSE